MMYKSIEECLIKLCAFTGFDFPIPNAMRPWKSDFAKKYMESGLPKMISLTPKLNKKVSLEMKKMVKRPK